MEFLVSHWHTRSVCRSFRLNVGLESRGSCQTAQPLRWGRRGRVGWFRCPFVVGLLLCKFASVLNGRYGSLKLYGHRFHQLAASPAPSNTRWQFAGRPLLGCSILPSSPSLPLLGAGSRREGKGSCFPWIPWTGGLAFGFSMRLSLLRLMLAVAPATCGPSAMGTLGCVRDFARLWGHGVSR